MTNLITNLFDKLILCLKAKITKIDSPTYKSHQKGNWNINQQTSQGNSCIVYGDVNFSEKRPSWSEKKLAVQSILKEINNFFYTVLGKNGRFGLLQTKNLDALGKIQNRHLKIFIGAKEALKRNVEIHAILLDDPEQKRLDTLVNSLLIIDDIHQITEKFRAAFLSEAKSITEEYLRH